MNLKLSDKLAKIVLRCVFISIFFIISPHINATEKKTYWDIKANKVSGQTIFFHAWGGAKNINSYIKFENSKFLLIIY